MRKMFVIIWIKSLLDTFSNWLYSIYKFQLMTHVNLFKHEQEGLLANSPTSMLT